MDRWQWEEVDVARSGSAGDVSKLFKNENVKRPGLLAIGAPPPDATVLAREVIQNSWDAARELQDELSAEAPDFRIAFRYEDLGDPEKKRMIKALGLGELARRTSQLDRGALGLRQDDCLVHLKDNSPLRILRIEESGTTGMYGPFRGSQSKMYLALVSIGFTAKQFGAGGSYGYGKAGLIRGSAIHSVVAYTCFREDPEEPSITRRLLGMTYWGLHDVAGTDYTGYARFGQVSSDGDCIPFVNEEADEVAHSLGIARRRPEFPEQLGTTFLLVEPTVDARDLRVAIERNWWPSLYDNEFAVDIVASTGKRLVPKPKQNDTLRPFIRGFEIATTPQDNVVPGEFEASFQPLKTEDSGSLKLGTIGLVSDVKGWSFVHDGEQDAGGDESTEAVPECSLVALVRGPKMVVEYFDAGPSQPFVRGTFVANADVDDLLRQTEPKAHDGWEVSSDTDGMDPDAPEVARAIRRRIRSSVGRFRRSLKPPVPDRREIRLPDLEKYFRQILQGKGDQPPPPPPSEDRPIRIHIADQRPEVDLTHPDLIRMTATVAFALSPVAGEESAEVELTLRYVFVEDGRVGDSCPLTIEAPAGFVPVEEKGAYVGDLSREAVEFRVVSDPYDHDWSGALQASADLLTRVGAKWE